MEGKKGRRNMAAGRGLDYLAQDSDKRQKLAKMLIKFRVSPDEGNFLIG
jgi:hypothetical protein